MRKFKTLSSAYQKAYNFTSSKPKTEDTKKSSLESSAASHLKANPQDLISQYFDRVEVDSLSLEQIIRSPLHQSRKSKIEKDRKKHAEKIEVQKEELKNGLQNEEFTKPGFKYAFYRDMMEKMNERLEEIKMVKGIDPNFVELLSSCLRIDPEDATNPDSYPIYPGSSKGIYPEDDPEFFEKWSEQNPPPFAKRFSELFNSRVVIENEASEEGATDSVEEESEIQNHLRMHNIFGLDTTVADFFTTEEVGGANELSLAVEYPHNIPDYIKTDIPLFPKNLPVETNAQKHNLTDWTLMRNGIMLRNFVVGLVKDHGSPEALKNAEENWDVFADGYYPTLFGYYNLLPREMREHPAVYSAFIGLEKFSHQISLAEKQEVLNRICMMVQPDPECIVNRLG